MAGRVTTEVKDLVYAQQRTYGHRKENPRHGRQSHCADRDKHHVAAYHNNIAMSEIQHLGNAVNHCISKRDDGIYTAQADAVNQIVNKAHTYTSSSEVFFSLSL